MTIESPVGRNGVAVTRRDTRHGAYRTYEIHQRRRVGESTAKLKPNAMLSKQFLQDPYPVFEILREHYPCYRDWIGNAYWITRYDDVTSLYVDDANYANRSKRWHYGIDRVGRDFGAEVAIARHVEKTLDESTGPLADALIAEFASRGHGDLAIEFAARLPLEMLVRMWGIPAADHAEFVARYLRMQRGVLGVATTEQSGRDAFFELVDYFAPLLAERRIAPADDMISVIAALDVEGGVTAEDLVATLLEADHETLHGALANLWFLLLTHPEEFERVREERTRDPRMMKLAYLEAVRHSTPVLMKRRYARHEVERFGQVFPEGALILCVAGAANRDPRAFTDPDRFIVGRPDLTQREPRGMYRADGLPSGITLGLGAPSKHPAVPEDRPRSLYAITRDAVVTASELLLDGLPRLRLAEGAQATLQSLGYGEMHTCWSLPVSFDEKAS